MGVSWKCLSMKTRWFLSVQFNSVTQRVHLCGSMDCSMPDFLVHHQLLELTQTHVHQVDDAIQSSHPLLSPFPPAFNLSQSQNLPSKSVSPIRKLPQASYPYPLEGRQNENHNPRKLIKLITWTTALSNSMKLWAMTYRATQDRWAIVERSDKTRSNGERNANHFNILALRTPWTLCKVKKIWFLYMF